MNMVSVSRKLILISSFSALSLFGSASKKTDANFLKSNIKAYLTLINNGLEQDRTINHVEDILPWLALNEKQLKEELDKLSPANAQVLHDKVHEIHNGMQMDANASSDNDDAASAVGEDEPGLAASAINVDHFDAASAAAIIESALQPAVVQPDVKRRAEAQPRKQLTARDLDETRLNEQDFQAYLRAQNGQRDHHAQPAAVHAMPHHHVHSHTHHRGGCRGRGHGLRVNHGHHRGGHCRGNGKK